MNYLRLFITRISLLYNSNKRSFQNLLLILSFFLNYHALLKNPKTTAPLTIEDLPN